jgi:hypothetical protein
MSKGSKRRPAAIDEAEQEAAWMRTFGLKIVTDETMPKDEAEIRSANGTLLGKFVNVPFLQIPGAGQGGRPAEPGEVSEVFSTQKLPPCDTCGFPVGAHPVAFGNWQCEYTSAPAGV